MVLALLKSALQVVAFFAHALQFDHLLVSLHANALDFLCPVVEILWR